MQDETIVSEPGSSGTIAARTQCRQPHFPYLARLARNFVYHGISNRTLERDLAVLPPGPKPGEPAKTVPGRLPTCLPATGQGLRDHGSTITSIRLRNEYRFYVDCPACAAAALYVCRLCAFDSDPRRLQHPVDADGHLSQHRHSCRHRSVELQRPLRAGDVYPHHLQLRTKHDHHGQRYRAYRVAIAQRRRHHQNLLSSACEYRRGHRPGDRHQPGAVALPATGRDAAVHHPVQRIERTRSDAGRLRAGDERTAVV